MWGVYGNLYRYQGILYKLKWKDILIGFTWGVITKMYNHSIKLEVYPEYADIGSFNIITILFKYGILKIGWE